MHRLLPTLALAGLIAAYGAWSQQRPVGHYLSDLRSQIISEQRPAAARGNLLVIEPALNPHDYQSIARLHLKLAAHLQQARQAGLLTAQTLAVFPEHIGSGLLLLGEKRQVYQARSLPQAMRWLVASNPLDFALALLQAEGSPRAVDALLRMKAQDMADAYQQLFAGLAREFAIPLVAGSIILPQPQIRDGRLLAGSGPLSNVSLVFAADGQLLGAPQYKQQAEAFEAQLLNGSAPPPPQAVATPLGRLGVLLGADADNPQLLARLQAQQIALLALPRFRGETAGMGKVADANWRGQLWDFPPQGARTHSGAQLHNYWLD